MDRLSVLIVEDEPLICQAYREYANRLDDVFLVSVTDDATKACELIQDHLPQAIILDLELQNGSGSGLDVLQNMVQMTIRGYVRTIILFLGTGFSESGYRFYHPGRV